MSLDSIGNVLLWLGGAYLLWVIVVLVLARLGKIPYRSKAPASGGGAGSFRMPASAMGSASWGLALSALISMVTKREGPKDELEILQDMAALPKDRKLKRLGDQDPSC